MTVGEIIEMLQEMDPDEMASFHMVTHSDMHVAAHAAGIDVDCEQVDRALVIYSAMYRFKVGMDPHLVFKALGRAADDGFDKLTPDEAESKPVVH
jgi:hypothetical protein